MPVPPVPPATPAPAASRSRHGTSPHRNTGDGGRAGGYGTRATFAAPRLTFLNALRAEICKALSLKSTYVLLIINALLLPAGSALMAWAMAFLMSLDPATGTASDDPQPVAESYMWGRPPRSCRPACW